MAISQQQVEHIARLARLELNQEELLRVGEQMGRILDYVEQLEQLNTDGIEPASHALPLANVSRQDRIVNKLDFEAIFQNAPEQEGHFFRVPQIMSEEV